jgi:hypothetical protein
MNAIVNEYQFIADDRIDALIIIEAVFLGIACLVFLLELTIVVPKVLLALRKAGRELKDEAESAEKMARTKNYSKMKKGKLGYLLILNSDCHLRLSCCSCRRRYDHWAKFDPDYA